MTTSIVKPYLQAAYQAAHRLHVIAGREDQAQSTVPMMMSRKLKQPTRLVLDYDGTITVKDTMSIIGTVPKLPTTVTWAEIVKEYMQDYRQYQNKQFPWKNYDKQEYSAWLESRGWVEEKSAQRVQDVMLFKGVTEQDVSDAVETALARNDLELRTGWSELLALFPCATSPGRDDSVVEILSVNWSETAIRYALRKSAHDAALRDLVDTLPIYANDIQSLDSPNGSTGIIIRSDRRDIRTNTDKLRCLKDTASSTSIFTVYVGDSSTDFDCLCAADLGIWLYDVPENAYVDAGKKVFAPLKYTPPPLSSLTDFNQASEMFYWSPNFDTVLDALTTRAD